MGRGGRTVKNILKIAASNIINLLSGVLVSFLLPKIIGVTDYGYYKTFTLYATYVGLFHFGIEDGIYLIYAGKSFDELDRKKFRFYGAFLMALEGIISVIVAGVALASLRGDMRFIFIGVALYLFSLNIGNYYQFVSQITSRFTELTVINIVKSTLTALSIVVMWLLHRYASTAIDYRIYVVVTIAVACIALFTYFILYRKITFGKTVGWKEGKADIGLFIKVGLPLMVANLCSTLILTIDRQFVNILFDKDTYAVYAFAYNMLALITAATSAVSTVLFPMLKQTDEETLKGNYSKLVSYIIVFVSACLLVYFPLCLFIRWYLPQYEGSLVIFRIILPGLVITSAITIVMHNYYKAFGANLRFFIKSVIILALSAAADIAAYYAFKSTLAISIASIIVMVVWYVVIEYYFIKKIHAKWVRNFIFMLLCMGAFYGITFIPNDYVGFAAYLVAFAALLFAFFGKEIISYFKNRKARKNSATGAEPEKADVASDGAENVNADEVADVGNGDGTGGETIIVDSDDGGQVILDTPAED